MGLETINYISDFVITNPVRSTDDPRFAADHMQGIKKGTKQSFPNIDGPVSATDTELSYVSGVTSAIQTQLDALKLLGYGFESGSDNVRPTPSSDSVFESLVYTKQSDSSALLVMLTACFRGAYTPGTEVFGDVKLNVDSGTKVTVAKVMLGDLDSNELYQNVTATYVFTGISSGSRTINAMLNSVGASEVDQRQIALLEIKA